MSDMLRGRFAGGRANGFGLRVAVFAVVALLQACLVTSKVDYDQPAIPATVERTGARSAEFQRVPPEADDPNCDGGGYMRFDVQISDLNREEDLDLRYVVNKRYINAREVPANGTEDRQDTFFCLEQEDLPKPCNLVEALVSAKFDRSTSPPSGPYGTSYGDLASAHWWVIGGSVQMPAANYLNCPDANFPDAGEP
jgi:hypothetical protein